MTDRIYRNEGNIPLLALLDERCGRLLDVGCGAGDNASVVKTRFPSCKIFGVTNSQAEAAVAAKHLDGQWIFDIEGELPKDIQGQSFDTIIFSHVLEHVRYPAETLARFTLLLRGDGQILIAVPNVLSWKMRLQFLRGRFEYESAGVLDDTHLRFFTFFTAAPYLLAGAPNLSVQVNAASGSVPLWWLRRYVLPRAWSDRIDRWGCRRWPNLFGGQVLISARKR